MSKKSRLGSIKRTEAVYGTVEVGDDREMAVYYYPDTDQIEIEGAEPGSTKTVSSYSRANGKQKIVSSTPTANPSPFSTKRAIFSYDRVIAIDTNSRLVQGRRHAICTSYQVEQRLTNERSEFPYVHLFSFLIKDIKDGINPERIGWHLVLSRFLQTLHLEADRLAIVVDSELGLHQRINTRSEGYYGEHVLPNNCAFVYASADADNETLPGAMIKICDKTSSMIFDYLKENDELFLLNPNNGDSNFGCYIKINSMES
jgi:hypothetical protein